MLIEKTIEGHYEQRWAIARALGRIGELDFTILIAPAIRNWLADTDIRKRTIRDLFKSILLNSTNHWYHKKALSYIERELAEGEPFPDQSTAIILCRDIGMWDEGYLQQALSLLYNIIGQQWEFSYNAISQLEEITNLEISIELEKTINKEIESHFVITIMYTLKELSFQHTPIPIIEHILKWLKDRNEKVKLFAALNSIYRRRYRYSLAIL
jgi:hypothetical protein